MTWIPPETLERLKNIDFKELEKRFDKNIQLPLLRKTFPKLIAKELVSVQPMTGVDYGEVINTLKIIEETNKWIEFFKEEEFNIK